MSNIGLVITVGSDIEVTFTPPYCCVCGVTHSSKRNLERHILGDGGVSRHPCSGIERILRLELETASVFKTNHFSARTIPEAATSSGPFVEPSSDLSTSAASPASPASFASSAPPASSTSVVSLALSAPPASPAFSASFTSHALSASSDPSTSSNPPTLSTSIASFDRPASSASSASLIPYNARTQDQYQSIMSILQNMVTQDQFQSLVSMISRLENAVVGMQYEVSGYQERTGRTIDIHEWRHTRHASPYVLNPAPPYSPNPALPSSPQRRSRRSSTSSATTSQTSSVNFVGVTASTPREPVGATASTPSEGADETSCMLREPVE